MAHLELEAVRKILSGDAGHQDIESAVEHLLSCGHCRAVFGTLADGLGTEGRGGPLQGVFDLIDWERQRGVESLSAMAEWAELRRTPSRRSQRERVRMSKVYHTTSFFDLVLSDLEEEPSWDEAEFLASLAVLCVERMSQRQQISLPSSHDLQGKVWTSVANSRRRAAEWKRAHQALANADRHLKEGTGDSLLKARLLSITASTLADQGQISQALDVLEKCKAIYEGRSEWALLARTLVKTANVMQPTEPAKGLAALDHAAPLLPADDPYLTLLAELVRAECLIEMRKPFEALPVYRRCARLLVTCPKLRPRIRARFTGARLLDALDFKPHAERLFDEVVDSDIQHELYKDAFLDLLYLYERHMKAGDLEKAARVCQRALTDSSLSETAHDQMRTLWRDLLDAAQHHAVGQDSLKDLRQYLSVHWKHPAATPPIVDFR